MIAEHFECDTLLCHRCNRLFVHVCIIDAHTAEYCKSFHEILIVFGKALIMAKKCAISKKCEYQSHIRHLIKVHTKSSNLLMSWITPIIWPNEFLMAIHKIDLCLNVEFSSTDESNRTSSYAFGIETVCVGGKDYEWKWRKSHSH